MATVKQVINENDVVGLTEPIGEWPAGTKGTVVSDHGDVKLVEISDDRGVALEFIQAPVRGLELVSKHSA